MVTINVDDAEKINLTLYIFKFHYAILLQSTAMAFKIVDERNVYQCVGYPLPTDVEKIVRILLNDSVEDAYISNTLKLLVNINWIFQLHKLLIFRSYLNK